MSTLAVAAAEAATDTEMENVAEAAMERANVMDTEMENVAADAIRLNLK